MASRKTQLIVIAAFAVLIVAVAIVLSQTGADDDSEPSGDAASSSTQVEELFAGVPQSGTVLGDPDAPVVVTEFADLQCPFCGEFARDALPQVIDEHVRSGEVALDLKLISFLGEDSREAAQVAAAATLQDHLWQFADLFYLNQGEENSGYVTEDFLTEIADATPGLDGPEAIEQSGSPEAAAVMDQNEATAESLGVDSTPSFFISQGGGAPRPLEISALTGEAFTSALESARGG